MDTTQVLDKDARAAFLEDGYVRVRGCFSRNCARYITDANWRRCGWDPARPETWAFPRVGYPPSHRAEFKALFPKAWAALCDLLGGEDRIAQPCTWTDSFIVNYRVGADRPWELPGRATPGWHIDGDDFRRYLDSPEQAMLVIMLFSDVRPRGGGTVLAIDSVGHVARYLIDHPEGLLPKQIPFGRLIAGCERFVELTGEVGDVFLIHPLMLHSASANHAGVARFITTQRVRLREPFEYRRDDASEYSPAESHVLQALGVEALDFRVRGPREFLSDERREARVHRVQKFLRAESNPAVHGPPELSDLIVPPELKDYEEYG